VLEAVHEGLVGRRLVVEAVLGRHLVVTALRGRVVLVGNPLVEAGRVVRHAAPLRVAQLAARLPHRGLELELGLLRDAASLREDVAATLALAVAAPGGEQRHEGDRPDRQHSAGAIADEPLALPRSARLGLTALPLEPERLLLLLASGHPGPEP
jgi:hypothetical protein